MPLKLIVVCAMNISAANIVQLGNNPTNDKRSLSERSVNLDIVELHGVMPI